MRIWFEHPAKDWNEALPLGNGRLGAMWFGRPDHDLLQLNHDTFWSGLPHDYDDPDAHNYLDRIRKLIFDGKESDAVGVMDRHFMGRPVRQQAYQPLGDLHIDHVDQGRSLVRRELDLINGIGRATFKQDDATIHREVFVSEPDQVLVVRFTSDKPGAISFEANLATAFLVHREVTHNRLTVCGQWRGDGKTRGLQEGIEGVGIQFEIGMHVIASGGEIEGTDVRNADSAWIVLAASTNYEKFTHLSTNPARSVGHVLDGALSQGVEELYSRHVADFSGLMGRVHVDLGGAEARQQPTDRRLEAVRRGIDDPDLYATYFQFGRYLLVSSSRPGTQPANLQGIWNKDLTPAWGSKWTTNINAQMNYWAAEIANLSECHEPLFDMLEDLMVTGAKTAKLFYNAEGWVVHHNTDIWRGAAPVDGPWGVWPMGSAWFARHPWEHFQHTQNREFLARRGWPIMKGAVRFILDFLIEGPEGTKFPGSLITTPSHSPENTFYKFDKTKAQNTYAASMDLMIVHDLFVNCLQAIEVLDDNRDTFEASLKAEIRSALAKLAPLQISPKDGRLQEWIEDYDEPEPGHRHMSHLYGLHPSKQIDPLITPELAKAARRSLSYRLKNGGGGTGWSRAWVVCFFSRLLDGSSAYDHLKLLLSKSTLPNLFDNHPPFQIDGNFGACSGIAEMFVQSAPNEIRILPALPSVWAAGTMKGLRAHGGITVNVEWQDHRLSSVTLTADRDISTAVRYGGIRREITLLGNSPMILNRELG